MADIVRHITVPNADAMLLCLDPNMHMTLVYETFRRFSLCIRPFDYGFTLRAIDDYGELFTFFIHYCQIGDKAMVDVVLNTRRVLKTTFAAVPDSVDFHDLDIDFTHIGDDVKVLYKRVGHAHLGLLR